VCVVVVVVGAAVITVMGGGVVRDAGFQQYSRSPGSKAWYPSAFKYCSMYSSWVGALGRLLTISKRQLPIVFTCVFLDTSVIGSLVE
jgi:hypothetical protein